MSRHATIITLDEFKLKLEPIISDVDFPYKLPSKIEKDISKIKFDFENFDCEGKSCSGYPLGYEVLENKLPVIFMTAGGDWEHPVCFILYWSGKEVRGYIPDKGNVYNRKEKCAYGSEEENDSDDDIEPFDSNADDIRKDIIERILIVP